MYVPIAFVGKYMHINTYDYALNKYVVTSLSLNFSTFIYDASVSTLYTDSVSPPPLDPSPPPTPPPPSSSQMLER